MSESQLVMRTFPKLGVGVMRVPSGVCMGGDGKEHPTVEWAQKVLEQLAEGGVIVLPGDRDPETGEYLWDFRIEGGPADQVTVERKEE